MNKLIRFAQNMRLDSWMNQITGSGTNRDKSVFGQFRGMGRLDDTTADDLYHEDDMASWICDAMPQYALRQGIELSIKPDEDSPDSRKISDLKAIEAEIMDEHKRLKTIEKVEDAVVWSNVYGGCVVFPVGMDNAEGDALREPIRDDSIQKISHLNVIDRRYVHPMTWYDDPREEKFGKPKTYMITPFAVNSSMTIQTMASFDGIYEVHESRLVVFDGVRTSVSRRQRNGGWGDSLLSRVHKVLMDYGLSWNVLPLLIQDANQAVFKMKGYVDALAEDDQDLIHTRMQLMDMFRSVVKALVLDAESEDFTRQDFNFQNLSEVFQIIERRLCLAARTPATILFGRSPAGENATGEADFQNWESQVEAFQESRLRSQLERLNELICLAKNGPTSGAIPENMDLKFPELRSMTPAEIAAMRETQSRTDRNYVEAGVLEPEEIAISRFGPDGYSIETSINIDSRVTPETPEAYNALHPTPEMIANGQNDNADAAGGESEER